MYPLRDEDVVPGHWHHHLIDCPTHGETIGFRRVGSTHPHECKACYRAAPWAPAPEAPPAELPPLRACTTAEQRKQYPIVRGLLDYFPDACAAVARVSDLGNKQHNPGEPMRWARGKSMDQADCEVRHLTERGALDTDGVRHSAKRAWRALADLQIELEEAFGLPPSRGSK